MYGFTNGIGSSGNINPGLDLIKEESLSSPKTTKDEKEGETSNKNNFSIEKKIQNIMFQMRRDIIEGAEQRLNQIELKFSSEMARLNNIIENQMGLDAENELMDDNESLNNSSEDASSKSHDSQN